MHSIGRGRISLWLSVPVLLLAHALCVASTTATASKPATSKAATGKTAASKTKTAHASTAARSKAGAVAGLPAIRSNSILVVDGRDSSVLLSKNADVPAPIASITKLMTALVVLDAKLPLDEPIKVTNQDRATEKGDASRLPIGTTLTRGDLMHLALMSSENRAAHALGRSYPGGIEAFIPAMNAKARALGMKHAHFADPTGLSDNNVASPEDLIKLVNAAARDPVIRAYSTDREHEIVAGRSKLGYRNTNSLVNKSDWDILVQKTGYTNAAGRCLVMKAMIQDRPVIMVLLNSFGKLTRVADASRVKKWMEAAESGSTLASSGR